MLCLYGVHEIRRRTRQQAGASRDATKLRNVPQATRKVLTSLPRSSITISAIHTSPPATNSHSTLYNPQRSLKRIANLAKYFWKTPPPTSPTPPQTNMSQPSPSPGLTPQFCFNQTALRGQPPSLSANRSLTNPSLLNRLPTHIPLHNRRLDNTKPQRPPHACATRFRSELHIYTPTQRACALDTGGAMR